jgi:hypothetical protein
MTILKDSRFVSSAGIPMPHLLGVRLSFIAFLVPATDRQCADSVILLCGSRGLGFRNVVITQQRISSCDSRLCDCLSPETFCRALGLASHDLRVGVTRQARRLDLSPWRNETLSGCRYAGGGSISRKGRIGASRGRCQLGQSHDHCRVFSAGLNDLGGDDKKELRTVNRRRLERSPGTHSVSQQERNELPAYLGCGRQGILKGINHEKGRGVGLAIGGGGVRVNAIGGTGIEAGAKTGEAGQGGEIVGHRENEGRAKGWEALYGLRPGEEPKAGKFPSGLV